MTSCRHHEQSQQGSKLETTFRPRVGLKTFPLQIRYCYHVSRVGTHRIPAGTPARCTHARTSAATIDIVTCTIDTYYII